MRKLTTILTVAAACGGGSSSTSPLENVDALVILQRSPPSGGVGDVFQYQARTAGATLIKLDPPTADGKRSVLCCDQFGPDWADVDIQSYDISFDARSIVMSASLGQDEKFGLFVLTLDESGQATEAPRQLPTNPMRDYVYPIFAAEDRIVFVTNEVVEAGAKQHQDEYERGTTTQLGSISTSGANEKLGPRNLSHRVAPSMLHTGQVLFTQWDHLGDENSGHLMMTNPDFTNLREVYGKENTGRTNSYLKAVEFPVNASEYNSPAIRLVTVATSRDRTFQAGKVLDVTIGKYDEQGVWRQAEANAQPVDHTPLVPGERGPSFAGVGRYYDAYPVRADETASWSDKPAFLVSWSDGPVEQSALVDGLFPDFGIYLFDSRRGDDRRPIFNDPTKWDVMARPLASRRPPKEILPETSVGNPGASAIIGSLDVYQSSLDDFAPGSIEMVRIIEGFSVEEGVPDDFGLTEHEGAALLGEAQVFADGSWAAKIPANVPVHLQVVDKFGLSLRSEPVWFSAGAGESRVCGGCHESRDKTTVISPGVTDAFSSTIQDMDVPRAQRTSLVYDRASIVGVPWEDEAGRAGRSAVQDILTAKCASCHDGDPNKPGNRSLTITTGGENPTTQTIVFDLRGGPVSYSVGEETLTGYSRSHLSLLGPDMIEIGELDAEVAITGDMPIYVRPGEARESLLIQKLNPPQLYPELDTGVRFDPSQPNHPAEVGGVELTPDEYYVLILMADMGGQFYSRENAPGAGN
jgi:hypothetical protein